MEKGDFHRFTEAEKKTLQESLLSWFDVSKRDLPWRNIMTADLNRRAYAVWVSEIMLQQTQVATVISYYERWMKKWSTLQDLARADEEDVNSMWSGLGYYSRGRRLLEGAQKVVRDLDGEMPKTAKDLQKTLPGVGRYTAGAIASIAFGEVTGLVDGNVMRVLSRLRMIGAYITQQKVIDEFWNTANGIVDGKRPGDFNQAMMELGATVCTPRNPECKKCPARPLCKAFAKTENRKSREAICTVSKVHKQSYCKEDSIPDIECLIPECNLCLPPDQPWDKSLGIHNLPRKPKKAEVRHKDLNVLIIRGAERDSSKHKFLVCQRPKKGLLAGLWEFPMQLCQDSDKKPKSILSEDFKINPAHFNALQDCGKVSHIFSHIRHEYHVYSLRHNGSETDEKLPCESGRQTRWITDDEFTDIPMSTGMKKVFKLYKEQTSINIKRGTKRNSDCEILQENKKQVSIASYFKASGK